MIFITYKNHLLKVPVMAFNAWGMFYGTVFTLIIGLVMRESFVVSLTSTFILSLAYLSLFGTVIAFWAYQTLVGTIGAEKAAYTSIINPVIAMLISTAFENIIFTPLIFIGILLCFAGNLIALKKRNQIPSPA